MTSLDEYLDAIDDDALSDHDTLGNRDDVDRALRLLGRLEDQAAANRQLAARRKAEIDLWLQAENGPIEDRIKVLRARLEEYARTTREKAPAAKSTTTPHGVVKTRAKQPEWVIEDEAAAAAWAEHNDPGILIVKKTINKQELKRACNIVDGKAVHAFTGQTVPGVTVIPNDDFTINIQPG